MKSLKSGYGQRTLRPYTELYYFFFNFVTKATTRNTLQIKFVYFSEVYFISDTVLIDGSFLWQTVRRGVGLVSDQKANTGSR